MVCLSVCAQLQDHMAGFRAAHQGSVSAGRARALAVFKACFEEQPESLLVGCATALHPDNSCPLDMRVQCLKGESCEHIMACR